MIKLLYYCAGVLVIILGLIIFLFPIMIAISWGSILWIFFLLITWIPGVNLIWKGIILLRVIS